MTVAEVVAIILLSFAAGALILSFALFVFFVVREIKEKPAEKFLVGFAAMFVLGNLFHIIAVIFIAIVN